MATRKIKDAKDLSTGELIYFRGHAEATFLSDGVSLEDAMEIVREVSSDALTTANTAREAVGQMQTSVDNIQITMGELENRINDVANSVITLINEDF